VNEVQKPAQKKQREILPV